MEIYKDVKGYEGIYQISNLGNVKSLKFGKEKILAERISCMKYKTVMLCSDGKTYQYLTHRLLAIAFIPNPDNKPEVHHKDEDRTNNSLDNLEWVTHQENIFISHGGDKHCFAKLSTIDAISIKYMCKTKIFTLKELANVFKVSMPTISMIKKNRNWKHI